MGTRSHPECSGCVVHHSTGPSPVRLPREVHHCAGFTTWQADFAQHGCVLPPPPSAVSSLRLAALAVVLASSLVAVSPTASATTVHTVEGAASNWRWPVDGPRVLVRPYIAPATPYVAGHRGIDIRVAGDADWAVFAPADGIVHFAGVVVDRPVLSIRHANGLSSSFEPVTALVAAGASIRRGQLVGMLSEPSGASHCSVPCLHFGVRRHGEYLSPLNYLGGIPHSVLLPTRPLRGGGQSAG